MSTYWGYRCLKDGAVSPHWLKSGEGVLRDCAKAYPGIKIIRKANIQDAISDPGVLGEDYEEDGCIWDFLALHDGHPLELHNEYGNTEPL